MANLKLHEEGARWMLVILAFMLVAANSVLTWRAIDKLAGERQESSLTSPN